MSISPAANGRISVYRIYGENDQILYVGCGLNATERVRTHRQPRRSQFAHLIVRWEIDDKQDIFDAILDEERQIAEMAPLFNVVGNVKCGWPTSLRRKSQLPACVLDAAESEAVAS